MIIDCHCHAGNGDGLTGPWDTNAPFERYMHRAVMVCEWISIRDTVVRPALLGGSAATAPLSAGLEIVSVRGHRGTRLI